MKIPETRKILVKSSRDLCRARRLYGRIVFREVLRNPDIAAICAQRAIARGLYSSSSGFSQVVFSIVRKTYKNDVSERGLNWNWHQWLNRTDHCDWHKFGRMKRLKYGKPVLRLIG